MCGGVELDTHRGGAAFGRILHWLDSQPRNWSLVGNVPPAQLTGLATSLNLYGIKGFMPRFSGGAKGDGKMGLFRKKPVVIEAMQWTGKNLREIIDFIGLHQSAAEWTWDEYAEVVQKEGLKIFTLEGPLMASEQDWIIKGINGEFYPCKPDIFEKTYEVAEAT